MARPALTTQRFRSRSRAQRAGRRGGRARGAGAGPLRAGGARAVVPVAVLAVVGRLARCRGRRRDRTAPRAGHARRLVKPSGARSRTCRADAVCDTAPPRQLRENICVLMKKVLELVEATAEERGARRPGSRPLDRARGPQRPADVSASAVSIEERWVQAQVEAVHTCWFVAFTAHATSRSGEGDQVRTGCAVRTHTLAPMPLPQTLHGGPADWGKAHIVSRAERAAVAARAVSKPASVPRRCPTRSARCWRSCWSSSRWSERSIACVRCAALWLTHRAHQVERGVSLSLATLRTVVRLRKALVCLWALTYPRAGLVSRCAADASVGGRKLAPARRVARVHAWA
jgi:hypothetical protein